MASTAIYNSSSSENAYPQHFPLNNQVMVASIIVLFCVIVFMIGLHIFAKFIWRSPRRNSQPTLIYYQERFPSAAPGAGLSKDSIAQLPTFTYRAPVTSDPGAEENVGVLECVVCLSEFQENEKGRLLPSCKHSFHIECIDMWFYNHSTCPLCRTDVLCTITTLPLMPQTVTTHEQQQEREEETPQEAHISIETTPSAPDNYPLSTTTIPFGNHHLADPVQIPTDLLFCSNSTQLGSSQSSEKASPSSPVKATRCIPHITIEIPTRQDVNLPSPGRLSMSSRRSRCTSPYDTGCSSRTPCKSPCLRESFKRMLNGQSSFKGNSIHIL